MQRQGAGLRAPYYTFNCWYEGEDPTRLRKNAREAEDVFRLTGITFNVYGREEAAARLIRFDIILLIISGWESTRLERSTEQRVRAIKAFLQDIYHRQESLHTGRILVEMVDNNAAFVPQMRGDRLLKMSTRTSSTLIWCTPGTKCFMY